LLITTVLDVENQSMYGAWEKMRKEDQRHVLHVMVVLVLVPRGKGCCPEYEQTVSKVKEAA
jgi:hypothetical protein